MKKIVLTLLVILTTVTISGQRVFKSPSFLNQTQGDFVEAHVLEVKLSNIETVVIVKLTAKKPCNATFTDPGVNTALRLVYEGKTYQLKSQTITQKNLNIGESTDLIETFEPLPTDATIFDFTDGTFAINGINLNQKSERVNANAEIERKITPDKHDFFQNGPVHNLNKGILNKYKFVDLLTFGKATSFQLILNNTSLLTSNGKLIDLNTLKISKFGQFCDYYNNTKSVGVRYEKETKEFIWYDFLHQSESRFKQEFAEDLKYYHLSTSGHYIIAESASYTYLIKSDGSIIYKDQNTSNGNADYKNSTTFLYDLSPDDKYFFRRRMNSTGTHSGWAGYGRWTYNRNILLEVIDVTNKTKLGSWEKTINSEDFDNELVFLNAKLAFVSHFGCISTNGSTVTNVGEQQYNINEFKRIYYKSLIGGMDIGFPTYIKKDFQASWNKPEDDLIIEKHNGMVTKNNVNFFYSNNLVYLQNNNKTFDLTVSQNKNRKYPFDENINKLYKEKKDVFNIYRNSILTDNILVAHLSKEENGWYSEFIRIYNLENYFLNKGEELVLDLDPSISNEYNPKIIQRNIESEKLKLFNTSIHKTEFIYIADSDSRTAVDWMNSREGDDIKQFPKFNMFVGGTLHNSSNKTFKVHVRIDYYVITSTTLLGFGSDKRKSYNTDFYIELAPGETKPFLNCLKDISSGYYIKSSTVGQVTRLADKPYKITIEEYDGVISQEKIVSQNNLIRDFATYKNIKGESINFNLVNGKTELNVYFNSKKDVGNIIFSLTENKNNTTKNYKSSKEYTGYKAYFTVEPTKKYTLKFLNKVYYPTLKAGIVQMFIDEKGSVTYEYKNK
jgi:hypothetical protein